MFCKSIWPHIIKLRFLKAGSVDFNLNIVLGYKLQPNLASVGSTNPSLLGVELFGITIIPSSSMKYIYHFYKLLYKTKIHNKLIKRNPR